MIKAITYTDIIKQLGIFLDTYSGLDPKRIVNADSIRGTDLSEMISSTESYSPVVTPGFLLFELVENTDGDNFITKGETETSMMTIQSYHFSIKLYGNTSPTDAQRISSIFKEEDRALELRDLGIFINGVSPIVPVNEFVNNTLLLRRDLTIELQVRYVFEKDHPSAEYFNEHQSIDPIVKSIVDIDTN